MAAKRRTALRTPEQARQWLRDNGVTVTAFAAAHKLSRDAVNDALRGVGKGNSGASHQAAVALGIKRKPNSGTNPLKVTRAKKSAASGRRKTA